MNRSSILQIAGFILLTQSIGVMAELVPSVGVVTMYDDNIYTMDNGGVDSWITKVIPSVKLNIDDGATSYMVEAGAETGVYTASSQDDYTDYHLHATDEVDFDLRNRLKIDLSHVYGHDDRGSGRTDTTTKSFDNNSAFVLAQDIGEPDVKVTDGAGLEYEYGAEGARGRAVVGINFGDLDYQNHTQITNQMDYSSRAIQATGYLLVSPRTSLLIEANTQQINYDQLVSTAGPTFGSSRDSLEHKYFVGAEWKATAKTEGSIKFGYQERIPYDSLYENFHSTAWEGDVVWRPKSYSVFRFNATRRLSESASGSTYVDDQITGANWRHGWSALVGTELFVQYEKVAYPNLTGAKDDIRTFGFLADYRITDSVILDASYKYSERNKAAIGMDYYRNVYQIGAQAKFQ